MLRKHGVMAAVLSLTAPIPNAGEHLVRYSCGGHTIGDIAHGTAQAGGESEEGHHVPPPADVRRWGPPLSVGYPRPRRGCAGRAEHLRRALCKCEGLPSELRGPANCSLSSGPLSR